MNTISADIYTVNMKRVKAVARSQGAYHHGDLRSALVASAGNLLERDGLEALSLRAIARDIGVSQTAPYNHFADKDHLLATLAAGGFQNLANSQVEAAKRTRGPAKKIVAIGCAYVGFARAHPQLYRLMFGVGIASWSAHAEVEHAKQTSYEPVKSAVLDYLGARADLDVVNIAAWALVHGLSMLVIDGALTGTIDDLVERAITRFVEGLKD